MKKHYLLVLFLSVFVITALIAQTTQGTQKTKIKYESAFVKAEDAFKAPIRAAKIQEMEREFKKLESNIILKEKFLKATIDNKLDKPGANFKSIWEGLNEYNKQISIPHKPKETSDILMDESTHTKNTTSSSEEVSIKSNELNSLLEETKNNQEIKDLVNNNSLNESIRQDKEKLQMIKDDISSKKSESITDLGSNVDMLPQKQASGSIEQQIINGLVDAIISNFKQQLFISFVTEFRTEMNSTNVKLLFPNLLTLLGSTTPDNIVSDIDMWKPALVKDLKQAPLNTLKFLNKLGYIKAEDQVFITEIINFLTDYYTNEDVASLRELVVRLNSQNLAPTSGLYKFIVICSKNLLDEKGELVTLEVLTGKLQKEKWTEIFVEAFVNDLRNANCTFGGKPINITKDNVNKYLTLIQSILEIHKMTKSPDLKVTKLDMFKAYLNVLSDLMLIDSNNVDNQVLSQYIEYKARIFRIAQLVEDENYKALISELLDMTQELCTENENNKLDRFLPYINFGVQIASAKSAADYKSAISSVIEPVGSYKHKRQDNCASFLLNSYPGVSGGFEYLSDGFSAEKSKGVVGFTCPIGLEYCGPDFGIFGSMIDLGAVMSYRLVNEESDEESAPQFGWQQVFSPGIFLLFHPFKDNPTTLGLGAQLTPDLRKVESNNIVVDKNAYRLGAFISMDIPLLTFYTNTK